MTKKEELRQKILAKRDLLASLQIRRKSEAIAERLYALPEYRRAETVMFFLSFASEVDTGPMILKSMGKGKRVAVPKTMGGKGKMVPSLLLNYPEDLKPGLWGIREPTPETLRPFPPEQIDLVVIPGVAFDRRGGRLGYGGGYYDRFFLLLRPAALLVAVAFELQLVDRVPIDPWDRRVDLLLTENRSVYCAPVRGD